MWEKILIEGVLHRRSHSIPGYSLKFSCDFIEEQKKLKDIPDTKGKVFINDEDLTSLRAKLFGYAKSLDCVDRASTANGRVHPQGRKHVILDTPGDLFKLGVESVDLILSRLGLGQYSF